MIPYLWVAAGSALGGAARYGFGLLSVRIWGQSFPWGTIVINVVGSFVISFFGTLTLADGLLPANPNLRIFVMVGICGGFTTFSSFSLQTLDLARGGAWIGAAGNVVLSVMLCLIAVTAGHVSAARLTALRTDASLPAAHIVALLDRPATAPAVLAAAALAAQQFGDQRPGEQRLEVLHIRPDPLDALMPTEEVLPERTRQDMLDAHDRRSSALKKIFDAWQRQAGIGTWREVTGSIARQLTIAAEGTDLLILGQPDTSAAGAQALHSALFVMRTATLLVPPRAPTTLGNHVVIAWQSNDQTARAIAASQPFLRSAGRISFLVEGAEDDANATSSALPILPGSTAISADVVRFTAGDREIGTAILAETRRLGADLLVMGARSGPQFEDFWQGTYILVLLHA